MCLVLEGATVENVYLVLSDQTEDDGPSGLLCTLACALGRVVRQQQKRRRGPTDRTRGRSESCRVGAPKGSWPTFYCF